MERTTLSTRIDRVPFAIDRQLVARQKINVHDSVSGTYEPSKSAPGSARGAGRP